MNPPQFWIPSSILVLGMLMGSVACVEREAVVRSPRVIAPDPIVSLPGDEALAMGVELEVRGAVYLGEGVENPRSTELAEDPRHRWRLSLCMRNTNEQPQRFIGYDASTPLVSCLREVPGGWTVVDSDWCGTGAEERVLVPGDEIAFERLIEVQSGTYVMMSSVLGEPGSKPEAPAVVSAHFRLERKD